MTHDPTSPSGSSGWLERWLHDTQVQTIRSLATIEANQHTNRADLLLHLTLMREHMDQRIDDLKGEIFPRFSRVEAKVEVLQASTLKPADSSTTSVRALLFDIARKAAEKFPWGHVFLTLPAVLLGLAGHLWHHLPAWLQWVIGLVAAPVLRAFGVGMP